MLDFNRRGSRPRSRKADANHRGTVTHAAQRVRYQRSSSGCRRLARRSEFPAAPRLAKGLQIRSRWSMMGLVEPDDLDALAAIVEEHGGAVHDAATPEECSAPD